MQFRMLGPLRLWDGSAWAPIRADQQRVVLAVLLIEAGRVVTADRLVEELWGDHPPKTATNTVQAYLTRLRRALGSRKGRLLTSGRGYELAIDDGELDATAYERLVAAGRQALAAGGLEVATARLADALALWRGPALADVPATPTVTAEAARLEHSRMTVLEDQLGARLDLGQHTAILDELRRLVDQQPLRERSVAQLMLALYRSGRRAEALEAYGRARRVLVDELGLEPGPQLRELQLAILADDPALATPTPSATLASGRQAGQEPDRQPYRPAALVIPAQLPPDAAGFTGRTEHLDQLDALLPDQGRDQGAAAAGAVVIAAITGAAGVGKTALGVHWAHRAAGRFPDGQLYVNLRGWTAGPPLRPVEALAGFLPALGVPAGDVPTELEAASALYRSLLAGRRMLVVLDNARHPDQVRPLLPGSSGCMVLVTSRDQLVGLVARDGAMRVALDVLPEADAQTLLRRLLGDARVRAEPAAVADLTGLCGHLPLALRIAAANFAAHPHRTIAAFTTRLRGGDRLASLEVAGDAHSAVRAAFDVSYAALPAHSARLFRLLGLAPGPDVTAQGAAALAAMAPDDAAGLLDQLASVHLVTEHAPGRYTLHDLLRRYAAEQAASQDRQPDRQAARQRLHDHYLRRVDAADRLLYPHAPRLPLPAADPTAVAEAFDGEEQAAAWLDAERPNLVAAVRHAAEHGPRPHAWRLAYALNGYLYLRMHTVDWQTVGRAGLAAAEADHDPQGQAAAYIVLSHLSHVQGAYQQSIDHCTAALALSREAGWVEGEAAALSGRGTVHGEMGQLAEAAVQFEGALAIQKGRNGHLDSAITLGNLGILWYRLGRLDRAADYQRQALAVHRRAGFRSGEADCLAALGQVAHTLGRLDDALDLLIQALDLLGETGAQLAKGDALINLAAVHRDAGRHHDALEAAATAVTLAGQIGERRVEADALAVQAGVHHHLGDHDQARACYQRALELARDLGVRDTEADALIGLAAAWRHGGHLGHAADHALAAVAVARQGGFRLLEGSALTVVAAIRLGQGRPDEAAAIAGQALAVYAETGQRLGQAGAHLVAGAALRHAGEAGQADSQADNHLRHAHALFTEIGAPIADHAQALLGPMAGGGRGWLRRRGMAAAKSATGEAGSTAPSPSPGNGD
jgi:DNA-binding SARP family transcriptional activator